MFVDSINVFDCRLSDVNPQELKIEENKTATYPPEQLKNFLDKAKNNYTHVQ